MRGRRPLVKKEPPSSTLGSRGPRDKNAETFWAGGKKIIHVRLRPWRSGVPRGARKLDLKTRPLGFRDRFRIDPPRGGAYWRLTEAELREAHTRWELGGRGQNQMTQILKGLDRGVDPPLGSGQLKTEWWALGLGDPPRGPVRARKRETEGWIQAKCIELNVQPFEVLAALRSLADETGEESIRNRLAQDATPYKTKQRAVWKGRSGLTYLRQMEAEHAERAGEAPPENHSD
jgi:hypothetical protein